MSRISVTFLVCLLATFLSPALSLFASTPSQADPDKPIWLDVGLHPQHVDWFNQVASDDDIARVDHVRLAGLLDRVTVGRKLIVFKSVDDAQRVVPYIAENIDIIGYNLEHGPNNPLFEQNNPVESVLRMRELSDEYGLDLALGPDRDFAVDWGVVLAPYVDMFIIQIQRVQEQPETVLAFVQPLVRELRAANPDMEISVQIRTEGDTRALTYLVALLQADLDGVSILTSPEPETLPVAQALVDELRLQLTSAQAELPAVATVALPMPTSVNATDAGPVVSTAQEQAAPTAVLAPTARPTPLVIPHPPSSQAWNLSLLALGIMGGGLLVATLVYVYQQRGSR